VKITLNVRDIGLDGTRFAWEADLGHDDILPLIQFFVEVGEGREGPWMPVNDAPIVNAFGYATKIKYQHSVSERTNYRIRAINLGKGGEESFSDVAHVMEGKSSRAAEHIARQERKALQRLMGMKCLHYPKMHFGPRCECYDAALGKRIVHTCEKCFNTGFLGGYYYPTAVYVAKGPMSKISEPSQFGAQENSSVEGWTSNEAIIEVGDLLVVAARPGERYIVRQIQVTSLGGATIRQTLALQRAGVDAPEMDVPVVDDNFLETEDVFRRHWRRL
jgi:hypothetical protein